MKKRSLMILISFCLMVSITLFFIPTQKEKVRNDTYSIQRERQEILNSLFDKFKFEIQGASIDGGTSPHIFIDVQDANVIPKVREYLAENLPYEYVKDYEIDVDVFSF